MINVAIGILILDHKILVACRPEKSIYGGLWEFPGGKLESHETSFEALKRELQEEIGIEVLSAVLLMSVQHDYENKFCVKLDTWQIDVFNGVPYGREGQEVRWVDQYELLELQFLEGNASILDAVKIIL